MTDNNCCGDHDHSHDDEEGVEFSEEVKVAIDAYDVFMDKYDIPDELSAEGLIQARMQTIYGDSDTCEDANCEDHGIDHDSPISLFMKGLILEAAKSKELDEEDIKYISETVTTLDEAVYRDFVRITTELQAGLLKDAEANGGIKQEEEEDIEDDKSIPSPFI